MRRPTLFMISSTNASRFILSHRKCERSSSTIRPMRDVCELAADDKTDLGPTLPFDDARRLLVPPTMKDAVSIVEMTPC